MRGFYFSAFFCFYEHRALAINWLKKKNVLLLMQLHSKGTHNCFQCYRVSFSTLSVVLSQPGNRSGLSCSWLLASECMFDDSCAPNERHYLKDKWPALNLDAQNLVLVFRRRRVASKYINILFMCWSYCSCCLSTYKGQSCGLGARRQRTLSCFFHSHA